MLTQVRKSLNGLLRAPLANALLEGFASPRRIDDYLELIDRSWSLQEIRARVLEVRRETRDVTSLWLQPNENWCGHRAGQHVQLTVTVDGVRRMRSFSISNAPRPNGALRLTVKTREAGCVSRFVHERARGGDVVTLSAAQGAFVLPERVPDKLLFLSGGSGLTPLVAMAQQLVHDEYRGSLLWLHSERDVAPLEYELRAFERQLPKVQLHVHRTSSAVGDHRLSAELLTELASDWQEREAFVCGPRGMMAAIKTLFADRGLLDRVRSESFQPDWQAAAPLRAPAKNAEKKRLVFAKSKVQTDARTGVSLLEQAEHAGLRPLHGCRMGICKTCVCTKLTGSVRNELTGDVSDARDEEIQLCIHTPLSDVSLDL